jgi:septum formation protein
MIILASKSQRRIDILNRLKFDFKSIPADVDENIEYANPGFLPCRLAELKAEAVGIKYPDFLTIGVDTLVIKENRVFGKPKDLKEAEDFLMILSGDWHSVISGLCIVKYSESLKYIFSDVSHVKFRKLNKAVIQKYFSKINPLDKAGAYAIQDYGNEIVEKVEGSFENIMGFPTEKFLKILNIIEKHKD